MPSARIQVRAALVFSAAVTLSGCGPGLCVGNGVGGCMALTSAVPRLVLSGLDGLSVRKNDCYPVTLSAVDATGNPMTDVTASVSIAASSGVVLYSSLQGCQTYNSLEERSAFVLSPATPQIVFYFRSDVDGAVSLSASTSTEAGLAAATQPIAVQYIAFDGANGAGAVVYASALASDGSTYLGGGFQTYDELLVQYVARLHPDGTLDTGFAPTGTGLNGMVRALSIQSDGKAIVGGNFTSYNGTSRPYVARLNTDGSLDTSFAPTGTGFSDAVYALSIQSDGKVLVGGQFTLYHVTSRPYLARLNTDGSLDTSFAPTGSGLNSVVNAISIQSDDRAVVGGDFTSYNGTGRAAIARLNTNGTLDTSFTPTGSGLDNDVYAISIQSDGKAVAAGWFTSYNGTSRPRIARLNANGSLDTSFAPTGTGLNLWVNALSIQSDGKAVVAGAFTSYNGTSRPYLARLNTDGSLDPSFAPTGSGLDNSVNALSIPSDGKVIVGGEFISYNGTSRPRVARLNTDGTLDTSIATAGSGLNGSVNAITMQSDGKAVVGGTFTSHNGTSMPYLARLNTDGTLDTSFAPTGSGFNHMVNAVSIQNDGKVVVGGWFTTYNGTSRPRVARLNSDGTLDTSFAPTGSGLNHTVRALSIDGDGKVIVGGTFLSYNGTSRPYLARLNTDGSLDTSFAPTGTGLNNSVNALSIQSDGKAVAAGWFTSYNGTSRPRIARLNANGSLDTSFAPTGTGLNLWVNALSIQSDGKAVVAGAFTSYNGTSRPYLARLNTDGSLDPSFAQAGSGLSMAVNAVSIQSDGKVIVGGDFTSYNGTSRPYLARLSTDGNLDASFATTASGLNGPVLALAIQTDAKIVVGGSFTTYNNSTAPFLVRLTYIGTLD